MKKRPINRIICHCNEVDEIYIRRAVAKGAHTLEELKSKTTAGTGGCQGRCTTRLIKILNEELEKLQN